MYVGVYLHDVTSFDQKNGVFDADFELWAKWRGELDHDKIEITNAGGVDRTFIGIDDDHGWKSARWRVRGTLRGEFPLHSFPFDEQTIAVVLELPEDEGRLVPDLASSGMAERFSLTDWHYTPEFDPEVSEEVFASDLGNLAREGRPTEVRRVAYQVRLTRPIVPVILKLFLPLGIIMLVALASLFVAADQIEARSAMGVTALLSCFAFQFTISDSLPAVAYLTLADSLFILAYIVSTVTVVVTILSYGLAHKGRHRAALWTDRVTRVVVPIAAGVAVWLNVPDPIPPRIAQPDPMPELPRHESSRDVVKIGSNILRTLTSSLSAWGLIHEDPELGKQVVFVERAPGVDNDAIRFLAGGEIEVTWRIREGVAWSDGTAVTADDVLFALELSPDPHIIDASAPDPRTVVLRWDDRLANALEAPWVLPRHALEEIASAPNEEGEPGGYDAVRDYRRQNPVPVLGPYHVTEYEQGARLVAEANPHFTGPPPNIERYEVICYEDRSAVRRAFENGEVDITYPNSLTVEDAVELSEARPDAVSIEPSAILVFLQPDLSVPLLSTVEGREAVLMAIDRERIADVSYPADTGRVAHIPVPGELPEGTEITPYDPDAAREKIRELGFAGTTLKLTYIASPTSEPGIDVMVENLEEVGITIERDTDVTSTLRLWRAGDHGGLLMHVLRARRESSPPRYWGVPLVDGNYDPDFRSDCYTDEVHRLVERERRALYPERRDQLRETLFAKVSRRLPMLPIMFAPERVAHDPALRNWNNDAEDSFASNIEQWYFE